MASMFLHASIVALLSVGSIASPIVVRKDPVTLSLTRHLKFTRGSTLPELDRARAHLLKHRAYRKSANRRTDIYPILAVDTAVIYTTVVSFNQNLRPCFKALIVVVSGRNRRSVPNMYV